VLPRLQDGAGLLMLLSVRREVFAQVPSIHPVYIGGALLVCLGVDWAQTATARLKSVNKTAGKRRAEKLMMVTPLDMLRTRRAS
jgi:hypothetical protein